MVFWLFSLFIGINAASLGATAAPQACSQQGVQIALTTSGYSLPLTSYDKAQTCSYHFTVPSGYFAYVDLKAFQLQRNENVSITDTTGVIVGNDASKKGHNDYSSIQSWPIDFVVMIQTSKLLKTVAQMSLDIQILPETPNANIVKSYVTFAGTSAVFIYSSEWNDGQSYKFTSKTGKVYVLGATDPLASVESNDNWNNAFIYEGGVFKGTLAKVVQSSQYQQPYISNSNEVILYCTKKVNVTGAVMVTDYSNVKGLVYNLEYAPLHSKSDVISLDATESEAAFTLVQDRKNFKELQLDHITYVAGPVGVVTYIAGGPTQNHPNAINVTAMPPTITTAYANTFYLNKGSYLVWFKI